MRFDELIASPAFLPGPAGFLTNLTDDLRAGRSVALALPDNAPPWIVGAVRTMVREEAGLRWVSLADDGTPPMDQLFAEFLPAFPKGGVRGLPPLYESPDFQGSVILLGNLDAGRWRAWKPFLEDFADQSRRVDSLRRSQFLVPITRGFEAPREDVCLVNARWQGVCGPLDSRIFAALIVNERTEISTLRRDLTASISAELALWDFELCTALVRLPTAELLEPFRFLEEYGRRSGLPTAAMDGAGTDLQWSAGGAQLFDRHWEQHSACAALRGDRRKVEHRLWKAQIGVLLPFVELHRQDLLHRHTSKLGLPFYDMNNHLISDPFDVEIGLLSHRLSLLGGTVHEAARFARVLKDIRNALAHLEAVTPAILRIEFLESMLG